MSERHPLANLWTSPQLMGRDLLERLGLYDETIDQIRRELAVLEVPNGWYVLTADVKDFIDRHTYGPGEAGWDEEDDEPADV